MDQNFIREFRVVPSIEIDIELYCDKNSGIIQSKEPRSHQSSKHVLRKFHLIREIVGIEDVKVSKVHTEDNVVDPLTKLLAQPKHDYRTRSMGLKRMGEWFSVVYFMFIIVRTFIML